MQIPLSKKISLIAPARIELPGASSNNTDKTEPSKYFFSMFEMNV